MDHAIRDFDENYDPDTLKVLCRAFDAAWHDIGGGNGDAAAADDCRTRLALIILELLELGRDGLRNEEKIKSIAVDVMKRSSLASERV